MASERRTCAAVTGDGRPCRAGPQHERPFCFVHDPERASDAAEARKLGGLRRRREGTIGVAYDLEQLDHAGGIRRLLDIVVADTLGLDNGIARSRTLIAIAATATRLLSVADVEARIEALESALSLEQRSRPADGLDPDPGEELDR